MIIEAPADNISSGFAPIARQRSDRLILAVLSNVSREKMTLMQALGMRR